MEHGGDRALPWDQQGTTTLQHGRTTGTHVATQTSESPILAVQSKDASEAGDYFLRISLRNNDNHVSLAPNKKYFFIKGS